jgi:hypothetical protein
MSVRNRHTGFGFFATVAVSVLLLSAGGGLAANANLVDLVGKQPPTEYDSADAALAAFKEAVTAADLDKLATILGVDAPSLKATEGVSEALGAIKEGIGKRIALEEKNGQNIIDVGEIMWPFPFPIVKAENGRFAFDPVVGIEEIINRRIGENEIQTIETVRGYVDAQQEYATADHDGDGVLEYAQRLVSSPGRADGLYWPQSRALGDSPAAPYLDYVQFDESKNDGYFGYRYKVLTRQGGNIAGGPYDYVINGSMISGFALVAWPVRYGETGVNTFVVNRNGIVYQADLGEDTDQIARAMKRFNPGDRWSVTED